MKTSLHHFTTFPRLNIRPMFALLLFSCVMGFTAEAGKGAFLKVTNLTPYTVNLSLPSETGMSTIPSSISASLNSYSGTWPASGSQYVESSNLSPYTSFQLQATAPNSNSGYNNGQPLSATIQFNEAADTWIQGSVTSSGLIFTSVVTPGTQFTLTVYVMLPSNRWMTYDPRIQGSTLQQICIPGAHDAGMYNSQYCSIGATSCNTQTQVNSFANLLNLGVRYFDCRPININYNFSKTSPTLITNAGIYLGHCTWVGTAGTGNQGCASYPVQNFLNDVAAFMKGANPSVNPNNEVVWLDFSHFMDLVNNDTKNSNFSDADINTLQQMITNTLGPYLIINNSNVLNTPISKLTANGPKVFVTFSQNTSSNSINGSNGIYMENAFPINSPYTSISDPSAMVSNRISTLQGFSSSQYNVTQWIVTQSDFQAFSGLSCLTSPPSSVFPTILYLADQANAQLPAFLSACLQYKKFPNVLLTDGITNGTTAVPMPMLPLTSNYQNITITTLLNNQNPNLTRP